MGDRVTVATVGAYLLFAGWTLHFPDGRPGRTPFDMYSPYLFAAAGVLCILLALTLERHTLALSGAAACTAFAAKALGLLIGMTDRTLIVTDRRAWLGVTTWTLLAIVTAAYWLRVLRPLVIHRRQ